MLYRHASASPVSALSSCEVIVDGGTCQYEAGGHLAHDDDKSLTMGFTGGYVSHPAPSRPFTHRYKSNDPGFKSQTTIKSSLPYDTGFLRNKPRKPFLCDMLSILLLPLLKHAQSATGTQ
jgi:hypothetical protein